jgi:hypothetical protein
MKGAVAARQEAVSCERLAGILLTAGALVAVATWGWAAWAVVGWRNGWAADVSPVAVVAITAVGFGLFLLAWVMCGNFRRRGLTLRLTADLALAQRDVAVNSYRNPIIQMPAPLPAEPPVAAGRQRPLTPPAPRMPTPLLEAA